MRKGTFSVSALTLSVLLTACGGTSPQPGPGGNGTPGSGDGSVGDAVPVAMQGEWHYGYISPIEYYNPSTGQYTEASGTSMILKLAADGTFERSGIAVITSPGCTSKILLSQSGIVDLDADTLTLIPKTSHSKGYRCSPSDSWEHRNLNNTVNTWKLSGSGAQAVLTLGDPTGKAADSQYNRPRDYNNPGGGRVGSISGRVTLAPGAGNALGDMVVMACAVDGGCQNEDKWRFTQLASGSTSASFKIENVPAEPYKVYAWKDLNGSKQPDLGDMIGVYTTDGETGAVVTPPAENIDITVELTHTE